MIKRYCDICGKEMSISNTPCEGRTGSRIAATAKHLNAKLEVEVVVSVDGGANCGDVCKYFVLDALYSLDDRARLVS